MAQHVGLVTPDVLGHVGAHNEPQPGAGEAAAIMLWGLAFAAVAQTYRALLNLVLLFFLEKMLYVATWSLWLAEHGERWPELFVLSPLTAVFFAVYGAGDLLFGLFFLWVGVGTLRGTLK